MRPFNSSQQIATPFNVCQSEWVAHNWYEFLIIINQHIIINIMSITFEIANDSHLLYYDTFAILSDIDAVYYNCITILCIPIPTLVYNRRRGQRPAHEIICTLIHRSFTVPCTYNYCPTTVTTITTHNIQSDVRSNRWTTNVRVVAALRTFHALHGRGWPGLGANNITCGSRKPKCTHTRLTYRRGQTKVHDARTINRMCIKNVYHTIIWVLMFYCTRHTAYLLWYYVGSCNNIIIQRTCIKKRG